MSDYDCPNRCNPDTATPYYYPPSCLPEGREFGLLIYADLTPSNRWLDGTAGVNQDVLDWYHDHDCLPHCIECHEEIRAECN